jgi:hypothetical protein
VVKAFAATWPAELADSVAVVVHAGSAVAEERTASAAVVLAVVAAADAGNTSYILGKRPAPTSAGLFSFRDNSS